MDKITSCLMSGINFTVEALEDIPEARVRAERAEQAPAKVYKNNNLEQLDFETEIDCAILGDACCKVVWDGEAKIVRITAPDIQGIFVWWRRYNPGKRLSESFKFMLSPTHISSFTL